MRRNQKTGTGIVIAVTVDRASFEMARTPYIADDGKAPLPWKVLERRVTSTLKAYLAMLEPEEARATVFDDLASLVIPLSLAIERGLQDLVNQYRDFPALNGQVLLFQGKERSFFDTLRTVRTWAMREGVLPSYAKDLVEVEPEYEEAEEPGSLLDVHEPSRSDDQEEA